MSAHIGVAVSSTTAKEVHVNAVNDLFMALKYIVHQLRYVSVHKRFPGELFVEMVDWSSTSTSMALVCISSTIRIPHPLPEERSAQNMRGIHQRLHPDGEG